MWRLPDGAAIMISTFGCANGITLGGARAYYAMARDGLFFQSVGKLHPRYKHARCRADRTSHLDDTPVRLGLLQPVARLHYLRRAGLLHPHHSWPVRSALQAARCAAALQSFWLSVFAGLYIVMATVICAALLRYKPQYTWPGLILVLLGIPVYLFWSRREAKNGAALVRRGRSTQWIVMVYTFGIDHSESA